LSAVSDVVASAVVAGAVSLVVTFGKIAWDGRQKKQERRLSRRLLLGLIASLVHPAPREDAHAQMNHSLSDRGSGQWHLQVIAAALHL
jgi:hypothetical protein